jgi:hypothetical protein
VSVTPYSRAFISGNFGDIRLNLFTGELNPPIPIPTPPPTRGFGRPPPAPVCEGDCGGHGTCEGLGVCECELGFAPPGCVEPMLNLLEFGVNVVPEPVQLLWSVVEEKTAMSDTSTDGAWKG